MPLPRKRKAKEQQIEKKEKKAKDVPVDNVCEPYDADKYKIQTARTEQNLCTYGNKFWLIFIAMNSIHYFNTNALDFHVSDASNFFVAWRTPKMSLPIW